jgi:hypothetical protein
MQLIIIVVRGLNRFLAVADGYFDLLTVDRRGLFKQYYHTIYHIRAAKINILRICVFMSE